MTERERFESWARQQWTHPEDFDARIKDPGKYNNYEVQAAWDAWQERAAQPAPNAVAYLDLGVGGYMDIGTDLTDEALAAIPKGRHMLGVIGTYGVDGYVPAQPTPSDEYVGWYCAHCQRGVDASEVTYHEQHQVCGRVITEDKPPKPTPSVSDIWPIYADPFAYVIQHLNSNPYPLTKDETITFIKELRALYNAATEAKP